MEIKIRNGKLYVDGEDRGEVHSLELRIYHRDTAEEIAERSKKTTEPTETPTAPPTPQTEKEREE